MKLKKIIAAVSAAAMVIGCMPQVMAAGDTENNGVSIIPEDFTPVAYNVSDLAENMSLSILNPFNAKETIFTEIEVPEKTKDLSVCFELADCDTVFTAWGAFAVNEYGAFASAEKHFDRFGGMPEFVINHSGSYEMIIPIGLFMENPSEGMEAYEYIQSLEYLTLFFDGDIYDSNAAITITDIKAYEESHTIEECSYVGKENLVGEDEPEPDLEPEKPYINGEFDGFKYHENEDSTLNIVGYNGDKTDIVIPSEIDGKKVTGIGTLSLYSDQALLMALTSVKIPDSVTMISFSAFSVCSSIKSIDVDENNTEYSSVDGVLFNKSKTELIQYPAGKTDKSYSVPNSVTEMGYYAFSGCSSLILIDIPAGVNIGNGFMHGTFSGCTSLTSVVVPDSVTQIEIFTFYNCTSLTSVVIPKSVTNICGEMGGEVNVFTESPNVTIYGYTDSYAEKYAAKYEIPFISIDDTANLQMSNGVEVSVPDNSEATLKDKALETELQDSDENSVTFNITLRDKDGNEVQPGGEITVKIPVPSYLKGEECNVYRKEADGTYTNMKAAFENGCMVFTTNHFSEYVLSLKELEPDSAADNTTSTDDTTASENGNASNSDGSNPATGFAIAIVPVIAASAAAVIFGKKRR